MHFMLNEEQAKQLKAQILKQIESWKVDEKQKQIAKQQINAMTTEQFEQFLKQNKIIRDASPEEIEKIQGQEKQKKEKIECIFCAISQGKVEAIKIDFNKDALAVLEINPISPGHVIIIPKKHVSEISKLPNTAFSLAKKLAKKLKNKMKAGGVEIMTSCKLGHCIINLVPIYSDTALDFPRQKTSKEELEKIGKKLEKRKKTGIEVIRKQKTKKSKEIYKMPRRIP